MLVRPHLYRQWLMGATVFDPTGGRGHLLEAFVSLAAKDACEPTHDMLSRLHMTEMDGRLIEDFHRRMYDRYGILLPPNSTRHADFLLGESPGQFDLIVGNPPWVNFADIPDRPHGYKEQLKPLFQYYGLIGDRRETLWGNSRIDLAALVMVKALLENLTDGDHVQRHARRPWSQPDVPWSQPSVPWSQRSVPWSQRSVPWSQRSVPGAAFFLPLSLFENEGAHNTLRKLLATAFPVRISSIDDLTATNAFKGIHTRYAMVRFSTPGPTCEAIPRTTWKPDGTRGETTHFYLHGGSQRGLAEQTEPGRAGAGAGGPGPTGTERTGPDHTGRERTGPGRGAPEGGGRDGTGPGHTTPERSGTDRGGRTLLTIPPEAKPRQGVNTCGANALFMFAVDDLPPIEPELLFPLIDRCHFREDASTEPQRYVFLPYDRDAGRVLTADVLESRYPRAYDYVWRHKSRLSMRRGRVIAASIQRGLWWSMLGVGPYTFSRVKIVWPAYGARTFTPRLFFGSWVPNQALQCSMSFDSEQEARRVLDYLREDRVERTLQAAGGAGTPGWAQPGRMRQFFQCSAE